MQFRNLSILNSNGLKNISIADKKILSVVPHTTMGPPANDELCIDFTNAIAFPGLINSHDHLDFNLFPALRNRIYDNYAQWGKDIQRTNYEIIQAVLKIPTQLRAKWGLYKNLLNGVTTVVDHGEKLDVDNNLITVFQNCYSLHSVQFEKFWQFKINKPKNNNYPFVIHLGEGTDESSQKEIDQLIRWNIFRKKIIAVHGVAMNEKQAGHFEALVWCPASNYFFLNATAPVNKLKKKIPILFGTDSTLTADWNLWEHLRLARKQMMLDDIELLSSLTTTAASIWHLPHLGKIEPGFQADMVIAKMKNNNPGFDAWYEINPSDILLIVHNGEIRLFDESLYQHFAGIKKNFSKIYIEGCCKYVQGDLPALVQEIKKYYPEASFPGNVECRI